MFWHGYESICVSVYTFESEVVMVYTRRGFLFLVLQLLQIQPLCPKNHRKTPEVEIPALSAACEFSIDISQVYKWSQLEECMTVF